MTVSASAGKAGAAAVAVDDDGCLDLCSVGTLSLNEFQIRMRPDTSPAAILSSVGSTATHCTHKHETH